MKIALGWPSFNSAFLFAAGAALILGALMLQMLPASRAVSVSAPAVQVSEARLAPVTEGLLRQTALHLSKMQGGASVGGFPGFEPPDDDEKYRDKIKNERHTPQDINDWVKEINNFLNQIVKRNPGLSLEKILQKQGLSQAEIDGFIEALQSAHNTAKTLSEYGVNPETVKILESLMKTLRVPVWTY